VNVIVCVRGIDVCACVCVCCHKQMIIYKCNVKQFDWILLILTKMILSVSNKCK